MPYADPEQRRTYHAAYSHQWNLDNKEARQASGRKNDQRRNGTPARVRQKAEVRARRHVRQRVVVLERYGGCCAFCGTTQYEHLTIDHIHGKGEEHRKQIISQYRTIYDFLYRTEFRPDLYRVLCWNCHMAMTRYDVKPDGNPLHDMEWWRAFGALRVKLVPKTITLEPAHGPAKVEWELPPEDGGSRCDSPDAHRGRWILSRSSLS